MSWKDQYKRMLRSFERIESADSNKPPDIYVDDAMHFFMDCWHLKDWIHHDYKLPLGKRSSIVKKALNSEILQTCAALANRGKHLTLRRENPRKVKRTSDRLMGSVRLSVSNSQDMEARTIHKISYYIVNNRRNTKTQLLDVARQSIDKWKEIITAHNIKLPRQDSLLQQIAKLIVPETPQADY